MNRAKRKVGSFLDLKLDSKIWWNIAGLGCLWLCWQSSGFYPLSLTSTVVSADATLIAHYHLLYSIALLILFAAIVAFRRKLENFVATSTMLPIAAGVCGVVGHGLLMSSSLNATFPDPTVIIAVLLVSAFIVSFVVIWGIRLTQYDGKQTVLTIGLSFVLAQIVQLIWLIAMLPHGLLMCVLSSVTALCCIQGAISSPLPVDNNASFSSLRELPLVMIGISLLLIYFCVIYVRLQMTGYGGDSSGFMKIFASIVSLVLFGTIAFCLKKLKNIESGFVVAFSILICGYFVGLCGIIVLTDNGETLARRILIADEHCVEVFLWMIIAFAVSQRKISALLPFSLYGILVVAMPWLLSFDVRYLVPAVDAIAGSEWVATTVAAAMLCTALISTIFLVSYALSISREAVQQVGLSQQELAEKALGSAGLTERELEVASYVFRGYSAKRIAETLFLSEPTVKSYTSRIYRKLGVKSKQELIAYVDEHSVLQ